MTRTSGITIGITGWFAVLGGLTISAQDKYSAKVPGGLAMAEFKGYEGWQAIGISRNDRVMAMSLGNPVMIQADQALGSCRRLNRLGQPAVSDRTRLEGLTQFLTQSLERCPQTAEDKSIRGPQDLKEGFALHSSRPSASH